MKRRAPSPTDSKGQTGNLRDLARAHTAEAITTLFEVMNDKNVGSSARVAAASSILDRSYGTLREIIEEHRSLGHVEADGRKLN